MQDKDKELRFIVGTIMYGVAFSVALVVILGGYVFLKYLEFISLLLQ